MRPASRADFEEEGGLYWPPYQDAPWFADRARTLRGRWATGKVLVVGCGWGFTVHHALGLGMDAWGCDVSPYALDRATEVLPAASRARLTLADATNRTQMSAVRSFAGLSGGQRFVGALTEDMLPVLTDAELATCLAEVRRVAQTVVHAVTPRGFRYPEGHDPRVVWRSISEWKAIVGPDLVLNVETGEVV